MRRARAHEVEAAEDTDDRAIGVDDHEPLAPSFTMIEKETREQAARSIERVCERLRKRQSLLFAGRPPVEIEAVVRFGAAAEGVLEEAEPRRAERIIVGTHCRSGLNRVVLGSVAERISRRARIPVVVVHGTRADGDVEEDRAA